MIMLSVNGIDVKADVEPDNSAVAPGLCGACTVHVEGIMMTCEELVCDWSKVHRIP